MKIGYIDSEMSTNERRQATATMAKDLYEGRGHEFESTDSLTHFLDMYTTLDHFDVLLVNPELFETLNDPILEEYALHYPIIQVVLKPEHVQAEITPPILPLLVPDEVLGYAEAFKSEHEDTREDYNILDDDEE